MNAQETVKIATGNYTVLGEWKTPEGQIIKCWLPYQRPNTWIFSGEVVNFPLYIGGSACAVSAGKDSLKQKQEYLLFLLKILNFRRIMLILEEKTVTKLINA